MLDFSDARVPMVRDVKEHLRPASSRNRSVNIYSCFDTSATILCTPQGEMQL